MPKKEQPRWVVANPLSLPKGTPLIQWREHTWYEGDVFEVLDGINPARLIAQGKIVEVGHG